MAQKKKNNKAKKPKLAQRNWSLYIRQCALNRYVGIMGEWYRTIQEQLANQNAGYIAYKHKPDNKFGIRPVWGTISNNIRSLLIVIEDHLNHSA